MNSFEGEPVALYPEGLGLFQMGTNEFGPNMILVSGQVDVEPWADDQEVTCDRIRGQITLMGSATDTGGPAFAPYVRMGLLVHEEAESESVGTDALKLNLAEQEVWEDFEWIWMWHGFPTLIGFNANDGDQWLYQERVDVDIRNRRKLGHSDQLLLFAQYAPLSATQTVVIDGFADFREILMSR